MALLPYTAASAIPAGFSPLPGRKNLFLNSRYPGFLFRLVANVDQAIACGGILIRGNDVQVMHFGLDLISIAKNNALGSWSRPTAFRKEINDKTVPVVYQWQSSQKTEYAVCDFIASAFERTVPIGEGSFIGVISRADRGLIVDSGFKAGIATVDHLVPVSSRYPTNLPTGRWVDPHNDGSLKVSMKLATVSGYISQAIEFDAKKFLAAAKSGFLDAIDAPDSVKSAYDGAYAKMTAVTEGEKAFDHFDVYPYVSASSQSVTFGAARRRLAAYTIDQTFSSARDENDTALFVNSCAARYHNVTRVTRLEAGAVDPLSDLMKRKDALAQRSAWVVPHEQHIHGHHFPLYVPVGFNTPSNSVKTGALEGATYRAVTPGRAFSLDSVPVARVELLPGQKLPVSSLFAKLGPRVGPALDVQGGDEVSIADRIELDIAEATGALRAPTVPTADANGDGVSTNTELEIECAKALNSLRSAEAVLRRQTVYLPPMSKFVFDVMCGIDAGARGDEILGLGVASTAGDTDGSLSVPVAIAGKPFSAGVVYSSATAQSSQDNKAVLVGYTLFTAASASFAVPETGRYCIVLQAAGSAWGVPTGNASFNQQHAGDAPGSVPGETTVIEVDLKLNDTIAFSVEKGAMPTSIASQSYRDLRLEITGSTVRKTGAIGYLSGALGSPNQYLRNGVKDGSTTYGDAATVSRGAGGHLVAIAKVGP